MKTLLALLLCLFSAMPAYTATFQLLGTATSGNPIVLDPASTARHNYIAAATSDNSVQLTGITSQDGIIVGVSWCNNTTCASGTPDATLSITGTLGESCTQVMNATNSAFVTGGSQALFLCRNVTGSGVDIINAHWTGTPAVYSAVWAVAVLNMDNAAPDDAPCANHANGTGSAAAVSTKANTANANEALFSLFSMNGGQPIMMGQIFIDGFMGSGTEYQKASTPGAYSNTATSNNGTNPWFGVIACVKSQ